MNPIEEPTKTAALKALADANLSTPEEADGLSASDFDDIGSKVALMLARALCKRLLRTASAQAEAKRLRVTADVPSQGTLLALPWTQPEVPTSQPVNTAMLDLLGAEASALDFADQLKKSKSVDVSKVLADAGLQSAPHLSLVSADVSQLLDRGTSSGGEFDAQMRFYFCRPYLQLDLARSDCARIIGQQVDHAGGGDFDLYDNS